MPPQTQRIPSTARASRRRLRQRHVKSPEQRGIAKGNPSTLHAIDDNLLVRELLNLLLRAEGYAFRNYSSTQDFLHATDLKHISCVITTERASLTSCLDLLAEIKQRRVHIPIIAVTDNADDPLLFETIKQEAVGFFEKPFDGDALLDSIREALAWKDQHPDETEALSFQQKLSELTGRERDVLAGLSKGHRNKIIAHELGISTRTVEVHRANLMTKLKVSKLSDLIKLLGGSQSASSDVTAGVWILSPNALVASPRNLFVVSADEV